MVVIAVIAESFPAAFHPALRADRDSTVRAVSNGWLAAADCIAVSVVKFDKAARASHSPTSHRLGRIRAACNTNEPNCH